MSHIARTAHSGEHPNVKKFKKKVAALRRNPRLGNLPRTAPVEAWMPLELYLPVQTVQALDDRARERGKSLKLHLYELLVHGREI
jgi:hypothetical protein